MRIEITVAAFTLAIGMGCSGEGDLPDACDEVGVICTVAGTGVGEPGNVADGQALESDLSVPIDVVARPEGGLYVVELNNHCVRELDREAGTLTRVIGSGEFGLDGPGCPGGEVGCGALELTLNHPTGVAFDGDDAIITSSTQSLLFRVDLTGGEVIARYGTGTRGPFTGDGGPASQAAFDFPTSVAIDPDGGIVVLDQMHQALRRIDPDGTVERIAGNCVVFDDVTASDSCAAGGEPVACPDSEKLTCSDPETTCDSLCAPGFAGDGGEALAARFGFSVGASPDVTRLTIMPMGTLVVPDTHNHRVREIDRRGVIFTIAGTGEEGFGSGRLSRPVDAAVGPDGTIYIADSGNDCVQSVNRRGEIERVAGLCGYQGFEGDGGPAVDALLDRPYGVEVVDGVLYIADAGNHRIRAVRLE